MAAFPAFDLAGHQPDMSRNPVPSVKHRMMTRARISHVFRVAHKAIWLGTVEATDERDAIERVAKERDIPVARVMATQRR
jgi:hypothetical protein